MKKMTIMALLITAFSAQAMDDDAASQQFTLADCKKVLDEADRKEEAARCNSNILKFYPSDYTKKFSEFCPDNSGKTTQGKKQGNTINTALKYAIPTAFVGFFCYKLWESGSFPLVFGLSPKK